MDEGRNWGPALSFIVAWNLVRTMRRGGVVREAWGRAHEWLGDYSRYVPSHGYGCIYPFVSLSFPFLSTPISSLSPLFPNLRPLRFICWRLAAIADRYHFKEYLKRSSVWSRNDRARFPWGKCPSANLSYLFLLIIYLSLPSSLPHPPPTHQHTQPPIKLFFYLVLNMI